MAKFFVAYSLLDSGSWEVNGLAQLLARGDESHAYDSHQEAAEHGLNFLDSAVKIVKVEVVSSSPYDPGHMEKHLAGKHQLKAKGGNKL